MIGRGTRTFQGKENLVFIDLTDNSRKHDLASVADLFGLPKGFDAKGESITKVLAEIEALAAANPGLHFDQTTDMEQVKKMVERYDIFHTSTRLPKEVVEMSKYAWIPDGAEGFVLPVGKGNRMAIRQDLMGKFEVLLRSPGQYGYQRLEACDTLGEAFQMGDAQFFHRFPGEVRLFDQKASWRLQPASEPQKIMLRRYSISFPPDVKKGDAGILLSTHFALENLKRR
jgi:hypothetical protein